MLEPVQGVWKGGSGQARLVEKGKKKTNSIVYLFLGILGGWAERGKRVRENVSRLRYLSLDTPFWGRGAES